MERRVLIPHDISPSALQTAGSGLPVSTFSGETMGTYWNAHVLIPREICEQECQHTITKAFQEVIDQMNHWDSSSELSRFNSSPAGTWHHLSNEFYEVLRQAIEISQLTHGAFDPTVGKLVNMYGFGPQTPLPHPPSAQEVSTARNLTGWKQLKYGERDHQIFQAGGVTLDLSSIAKGYAVDNAVRALKAQGVHSCLVEIGGEFRGEGCKADGKPWWVNLEQTGSQNSPAEITAALCGLSLATSGVSIKQRTLDGKLYTHLVDPHTSQTITDELVSVSVLAPCCMEADAWATALFVLGLEDGLKMAAQYKLMAYFRYLDDSAIVEQYTEEFASLLD
ncbi:FAD:protein FMN transferase [Rubritalea halochordaticola]|uniref:FAD:protein FMN transferase n=1 Tax=Rubritalea halochordaticola TaxID=714537 RepID=A0ABP9UW21_9BACT